MKNILQRLSLVAIVILSVTFTACKKEPKSNANDSTNTKDANGIANAFDATSDDAAAMAGQVATMAGKTASGSYYMLCGQTVVDTGNGRTITITYDGTTICNGVQRTGTVVITLANGSALWDQPGAIANVAVNSVKVTDVTSSNSFTLNGNYTVTNETGGLAWELWWTAPVGTVVKHRETSTNMSVVFSDGTTGSWSVDRTRTWSKTSVGGNNVITYSVSSENSGNKDTWGTNRYGEAFSTNIATPISANNYSVNCEWRPFQGKYVYTVPSRNASASLLFGTDASGHSVGNATTCAPGYFLSYTLSTYNYTLSLYLPYW